jgi:GT2 family glycosyltransferase
VFRSGTVDGVTVLGAWWERCRDSKVSAHHPILWQNISFYLYRKSIECSLRLCRKTNIEDLYLHGLGHKTTSANHLILDFMKVSFLVPVYNTDAYLLKICVNSIFHAVSDCHELVLIDDATDNDETLAMLEKFRCLSQYNVKVIRNSVNSGVSYSLNSGASASSGDFLAPVDHDDLVVKRGFLSALRLQEYYGCSWLYTDEAQTDRKGYLINNLFKPAFSKQLLRSVMYINHLQLFSRDLFDQVGGYRLGFEGSQDHDLALRMTEVTTPRHVPTIGYLWRILPTTQSRENYLVNKGSLERSREAINEHFQRLGHLGEVTVAQEGTSTYNSRIRSSWKPKVSVIIPCKLGTTKEINGTEIVLLEHCLKSLRDTTHDFQSQTQKTQLEVILVINQNDEVSSADYLLQHFELLGHSVRDESDFNFSRKCNLGASQSSGDILIFLNDDTQFITKNWLDTVVCLLSEDDVAAVGAMLLNADGTVQSCGDRVGESTADHYRPDPLPDNSGDSMQRYLVDHETTSITGAFLCCRTEIFQTLNGFSSAFPNSYQDVDFCVRARRQNFRCVIAPSIRIVHFESCSREPAVDVETLETLRLALADMIAPLDPYQLWRYQPIRVQWSFLFTYQGIVYFKIRLRILILSVRRALFRRLSWKPRTRYKLLIR